MIGLNGAEILVAESDSLPPRRLRVFAFDPFIAGQYVNRDIREVEIALPWDLDPDAKPGPVGEYLEVVDYDPASGAFYPPVD